MGPEQGPLGHLLISSVSWHLIFIEMVILDFHWCHKGGDWHGLVNPCGYYLRSLIERSLKSERLEREMCFCLVDWNVQSILKCKFIWPKPSSIEIYGLHFFPLFLCSIWICLCHWVRLLLAFLPLGALWTNITQATTAEGDISCFYIFIPAFPRFPW